MAQKPPAKPQSRNTVPAVLAYSRRFLLYGFGISIVLHVLFGPFVEWKRMPEGQKEQIEKVSVTKVVTPKPTATPTPPPTPTPPSATPKPQPSHVVQRLKINVVKTTSKSESGPSENAYVAPKTGSESGVPEGNANTGPPAAPGTAAPAPTPTKPACAVPNAPAVATQKVTPDMPEIARQMGASGTAQIKVTLDASGNVTGASVYTSTHNSALDKAALQAAQQSKYSPEVDNCVKTAGSYLYVVTFESQ